MKHNFIILITLLLLLNGSSAGVNQNNLIIYSENNQLDDHQYEPVHFPLFPLNYMIYGGDNEYNNDITNYGQYVHANKMKDYGIIDNASMTNITELISRLNNLEPGAPLYEDGGFDLFTAAYTHAHDNRYYGAFFEPGESFHADTDSWINYIDQEYIDLRYQYSETSNITEKKMIAQNMQEHMLNDLLYIPLWELMDNVYFNDKLMIDNNEAQLFYSSYRDFAGYSEFWAELSGLDTITILDNVCYDAWYCTNPLDTYNGHTSAVFSGLFDIRYNYNDKIYYYAPNIALGDPYWMNPNEVIIEINPLAKFNNNNSITTWDVVNTYLRGFIDSVPWSTYGHVSQIMKQDMNINDTVKVLNDTHVMFSFEKGGDFNLKALTTPIFDDTILSNYTDSTYYPGYIRHNGTTLQIGATGPFVYDEFMYDSIGAVSDINLIRNPNYWMDSAQASKLQFKYIPHDVESQTDYAIEQFVAGNIDIISPNIAIPTDKEGQPISNDLKNYDITNKQVSFGSTQTIWVNMEHPIAGIGLETPLAQYDEYYERWKPGKFVRNAISLLADRQAMIDNHYVMNTQMRYYGIPTDTHWSSQYNHKSEDLRLDFLTKYDPHWAAYNLRTAGYILLETDQIRVISDLDDTAVKFVLEPGYIFTYSEFEEAELYTRVAGGEATLQSFELTNEDLWVIEMPLSEYESLDEFQIVVRGDTTIGGFQYINEGDLPCIGKTPWLNTLDYYDPFTETLNATESQTNASAETVVSSSATQVTPFDISQLPIPILPVILSMIIAVRFRNIKKNN